MATSCCCFEAPVDACFTAALACFASAAACFGLTWTAGASDWAPKVATWLKPPPPGPNFEAPVLACFEGAFGGGGAEFHQSGWRDHQSEPDSGIGGGDGTGTEASRNICIPPRPAAPCVKGQTVELRCGSWWWPIGHPAVQPEPESRVSGQFTPRHLPSRGEVSGQAGGVHTPSRLPACGKGVEKVRVSGSRGDSPHALRTSVLPLMGSCRWSPLSRLLCPSGR